MVPFWLDVRAGGRATATHGVAGFHHGISGDRAMSSTPPADPRQSPQGSDGGNKAALSDSIHRTRDAHPQSRRRTAILSRLPPGRQLAKWVARGPAFRRANPLDRTFSAGGKRRKCLPFQPPNGAFSCHRRRTGYHGGHGRVEPPPRSLNSISELLDRSRRGRRRCAARTPGDLSARAGRLSRRCPAAGQSAAARAAAVRRAGRAGPAPFHGRGGRESRGIWACSGAGALPIWPPPNTARSSRFSRFWIVWPTRNA